MFLRSCLYEFGTEEQLQVDLFNEMETVLDDLFTKATKHQSLGKTIAAVKNFDYLNDLMYLNVYFSIVRANIKKDLGTTTGKKTYDEYELKFTLDCIRETFANKGINIDDYLDLYGLSRGSFSSGISLYEIEGLNDPLTIN